MSVKKIITLSVFLIIVTRMSANTDSLRVTDKRTMLLTTTGLGFSSSFYLLYQQWYKPYSSGQFSFFDDSEEWLGMDKVGHFTSSWFIHGNLAQLAMQCGFSEQQANLYGVVSASVFMTSIEIMDGFSQGWGFSWSDYSANLAGIAYSSLQFKLKRHKLPILKYSWQPDELPSVRSDLLGNSTASRMLKNYNEQTYWLSVPLNSVYQKWPSWFCFSLGYGANGMLGGRDNVWWDESGNKQDYSLIPRRSEWKFSFDIDITRLPLKKKWQRNLAGWLRWIKIPAPTLSVGSGTLPKWHLIYW